MTKKCIIIGCGSHASAIISIVESSYDDYEIVGLVDTADDYDAREKKSGYSVILNLQKLLRFSDKYINFDCVLAIGDNAKRAIAFTKLRNAGFNFPNVVSRSAFVDRTVIMGDGNVVAHNSVINAQATLGSNNLINTGAIVEHHCCIKDHVHIGPLVVLCGGVAIADFVFIGAGATIIPSVSVAERSTVGAGALLVTDVIEKKSMLIGVPAKVKNI